MSAAASSGPQAPAPVASPERGGPAISAPAVVVASGVAPGGVAPGGVAPGGRGRRRLSVEALVVAVVGLVLTAALAWTSGVLNRSNEHRLLRVETLQAGDVIAGGIQTITSPLATALTVEAATGDNPADFASVMAPYVGPTRTFISASLWRLGANGSITVLATLGAPAEIGTGSAQGQRLGQAALHSPTFAVVGLPAVEPLRIGYAMSKAAIPGLVAYGERSIPANRIAPIEHDPAFAELNYASYLGTKVSSANLTTTDVGLTQLPLRGETERDVIPFGNTSLTLVAQAKAPLDGVLAQDRPWIVLTLGVLFSVGPALATEQLVRRRRRAEDDAATIASLYAHLGQLYGEERNVTETLQRALLPSRIAELPGLQIATRYAAGAEGALIGGDWYSLVPVDERRFAFVVGDVSGRGVAAATIMARLRFTLQAYLVEGHPPEVALARTAEQLDINRDGYLATVLVGVGDLDSRQLVLANAGHLSPLLCAEGTSATVSTVTGPPLGLGVTGYVPTRCQVPVGATFLAFTDGLVERRGEDIDTGLARLSAQAIPAGADLDAAVTDLLAAMTNDGNRDDIAILAFRWPDDRR